MPWVRWAGGVVVSLALAAGARAESKGGLESEITEVARQLAKALASLNQDSVTIGQFSGPPQVASSAGPGIAKLLAEALAANRIAVRPGAKLGLEGKYQIMGGASDAPAAVRLTAQLVDVTGKVVLNVGKTIRDAGSIALLLGPTGNVGGARPGTSGDPAADMLELVTKPHTNIARSVITPAPNSPYGIELCVRAGTRYLVRHPVEDSGLAYAPIRRDEVYAVNLINRSPYAAAVILSIDGLNAFAFSENREYRHYIVPPMSQHLVRGWHRNNASSDEFLVTSYAQSAAATGNVPSDQVATGTITATFARAWPEGAEPAAPRAPDPAEPLEAPELPGGIRGQPEEIRTRNLLGTGKGEKVASRFQEVRHHVGPLRAVVSVRYTKEDPDTEFDVKEAPLDTSPERFAGDWVEVGATVANVKVLRDVIVTVGEGDVLRLIDGNDEWAEVAVELPNRTERGGWIFRRNLNSIPSR